MHKNNTTDERRRRSLKLNYVIYVRVKAIVVIFVPFKIIPTFDLDITTHMHQSFSAWERGERERNWKLKMWGMRRFCLFDLIWFPKGVQTLLYCSLLLLYFFLLKIFFLHSKFVYLLLPHRPGFDFFASSSIESFFDFLPESWGVCGVEVSLQLIRLLCVI